MIIALHVLSMKLESRAEARVEVCLSIAFREKRSGELLVYKFS